MGRVSVELVIRAAHSSELEALVSIQREASLAALAHIFPPERYPYPTQAVRERWRVALADRDADLFVAEQGGASAGVAFARLGWLDGLYVLPDFWGAGVARALHDRAVARLRELGHERARLWVLEQNQRARRFYERRGWRPDGSTRVVPYPPNPLDVGYTLELPHV